MSRLHKIMDNNPGHSTIDIAVHKFKHIYKATESDKYVATDNPDVISFVPILQSSTYSHGLGTNQYSFKVDYYTRSPSLLGTPTIPLVSPTPCSPSYHVHTPSPSPPLLAQRIQSPSPPIIINGADTNLIACLQHYAHLGPPFIKNRSNGCFCIGTLIKDADRHKWKAKYVQFLLNDSSPHTLLTMGCGHPVYVI